MSKMIIFNKSAGDCDTNWLHGNHTRLLAAKKDESVFSDPTYNVSVLFGKRDEPLLLACARQLIEHISGSGSARSLVISLGLKDHSQGTLKDIIAAMIDNRLW
ncbi:hypothetical protein PVAP13_5KG022901 [Panicum virgatum]|uniref:Proteasome assembly chaperone 3 n=1 Tax=Panicum virgatum TaxID=38727 RepID=A0A8T0S9H4_PANVG|nr:hypothetical protein PVAP13_5KG022901 [Panicum virgatum]